MKIDLHIHTTISDGTDSPSQLLGKLREMPIDVFSVTDHDSIRASEKIQHRLQPGDPRFIPGVELSARDDLGRYHILGFAYRSDAPSLRHLTEKTHAIRVKKTRGRIAFLKERYGLSFPEEELAALQALPNPGKPHVGNLIVSHGYASNLSEAIRKYVDPYHGKFERVTPGEAIGAILDAGGIPVLAHGVYGDGRQYVEADEMDARVASLVKLGLMGIECYYSRYGVKETALMQRLCARYDLLATAGSDYHGTNKPVKLGENHLQRAEDDDRVMHFLETCFKRC
ncbi:MAG: PHP domain-containing protein [Lachnospiraceae bacterium]|nr:PHP domain-containing protein [Lachnospiraceae bacterium]